MYYLINKNTLTINSSSYPNVGYLALVNSTNIIVEGLQIKNHGQSLLIAYSANLEIKNSNVSKVELYKSDNNSIWENTVESQRGGVYLLNSSNNGIFRNHMLNNYGGYGIYLEHSSNNTVNGNIMTMNTYGIYLLESSSNNISRNNIVQNSRCDDGICCLTSSYNLFYYNNVSSSDYGIALAGGSNNMLVGNIISNNGYAGIYFASRNSILMRNNVSGNGQGIQIRGFSYNNTLIENIATNNGCGVFLESCCYNNTILGNSISNNLYGVSFYEGVRDTIFSGNNVSNNNIGLYIYNFELGGCNKIFHNNFINNTAQVSIPYSDYENIWDDGYPSGGNYWSNYTGVDTHSGPNQVETESDGIGDTPYDIDENNQDRYPLMGPFNMFDAGTWNGLAYNVDVITNSTVSNFKLNTTEKTISFNVSGLEFTAGFCRVTIPNIIIQDLWQGNFTVLLNGEPWPFRNWTDPTYTYIYINYTHTEHEITIIPEFPSTIILPLFTLTTLIATILLKKKRKTKPKLP
jgi:parallel beta-helix repeat protein